MEAGALQVGFRAAQRSSIGVRTHQNAGEVFGSGTQRDAKTLISEKPGKSSACGWAIGIDLPIGPGLRLRRAGGRGWDRWALLGDGIPPDDVPPPEGHSKQQGNHKETAEQLPVP